MADKAVNPAYLEESRKAYETFCQMLGSIKATYKKNDELMKIKLSIKGEHCSNEINIEFSPVQRRMYLMCRVPVMISEDNRLDAVELVNKTNGDRVVGTLDINIRTGELFTRVSSCIAGNQITTDHCLAMLQTSWGISENATIDFRMLEEGQATLATLKDKIEARKGKMPAGGDK